jgi:hypothetical protein
MWVGSLMMELDSPFAEIAFHTSIFNVLLHYWVKQRSSLVWISSLSKEFQSNPSLTRTNFLIVT